MKPSRKQHIATAAACIILMLAAACSQNVFPVWSSFLHVGVNGWDTMETLDFSPDVEQLTTSLGGNPHATENLALAIAIRHNRELPYQDLRLQIERSDSTGILACDTITLHLTDSQGNWQGHKTNALTETVDTIPFPVRLTPGFTLSLTPAMKEEIIPGIVNVGVILFRPDRTRKDMETGIPGVKKLKL